MNPDEFAAKWSSRVAKMPQALQECIRTHTAEVFKASKDHIKRDIMDKPPDTYASSLKEVKTVPLANSGMAKYKGKSFVSYVREGKGKMRSRTTKQGEQVVGLWLPHTATEAEARSAVKRGEYDWRTAGRGKAKWGRTGHLEEAEHWFMEAGVGVILNTMDYALPRHDLGLAPGNSRAVFGSSRKSPPKAGGGENRIAPWRKDAIADIAPQKDAIYTRIIGDALK